MATSEEVAAELSGHERAGHHAAVGVRVASEAVDWPEVFTSLVPGGHLAVVLRGRWWRAAAAIEAAGFEVRDTIMWRSSAADRNVVLARKPMSGTGVANLLAWSAGPINVSACRVGLADQVPAVHARRTQPYPRTYDGAEPGWGRSRGGLAGDRVDWEPSEGRWPTNLVFSHSVGCAPLSAVDALGAAPRWVCRSGCPVGALNEAVGSLKSGAPGFKRLEENRGSCYGAESRPPGTPMPGYGDKGGASRFFPCFPAGDWWMHNWLVRLVLPSEGVLMVLGEEPEPLAPPVPHEEGEGQVLALFA